MNMPAVEAKIQGAVSCAPPMASPIRTPMRHNIDDNRLQIKACLMVIPARSSTAKSPEIKSNYVTGVTH